MKPKAEELKHATIAAAVAEFTHDLWGVKSAEMIACPLISTLAKDSRIKFRKFTADFKSESESENSKTTYNVPLRSHKEFRKLQRLTSRTQGAVYHTPRALLVALVSAFDAYLGRLLRAIFILRPQMIDSSDRALTFSDLVKFNSLEIAREHIIESEIESFLRKSHIEHFHYLEQKLSMELRKNLNSWPVFVELMQRRNLFVHCDGIVSKQYLLICSDHGVDVSELVPGNRLHIDAKYFKCAFECLYEIGVKLAHTVWRKLAPAQLAEADNELNESCYQLLEIEEYRLAYELLTFATKQKKHSTAFNRRMLVINLAIAVKFGEINLPESPLDSEDWSDCSLSFALALAVLQDRTNEACVLMRQIGNQDELIGRHVYDSWPLFRDFRETDVFQTTYKELFGDEFRVPEIQNDRPEEEPMTEN